MLLKQSFSLFDNFNFYSVKTSPIDYFGIAPRRFPLVEYVTATELLCQRLEEAGDDESQEKARMIRNEVFLHLKRGYKMKLKSNLSPEQRQILKELKEDDSIIIFPAEKGKAVVVEDRHLLGKNTRPDS